jgi:four helix bundle protein
LENSLGSAYETETVLMALIKLYEYLKEEIGVFLERIAEIQKMLVAFITKLKEPA